MEENIEGILSKYESFTEEEYKESNCMSYSLFKDIYNNPELLTTPKEEKKEEWLVFGTLVDLLLTSPSSDINDKIAIFDNVPSPQFKKMADYIYDNNIDITNITDEQIIYLYDYAESKLNWGIGAKKKNLLDNCELYLSFLKENKDKIIVDSALFNEATMISNLLLTHPWTKFLFLSKAEQKANNIEIFYQYKIRYSYRQIVFKSKIDILIVNHDTKTIYIYDLKTGSDYPRQFAKSSIYKFKYTYQAYLYHTGLTNFIKDIPEYKDYTVDDFRFVYISRVDPRFPIILKISDQMQYSFQNFGLITDKYELQPIDEIIDALKFYLSEIEVGNSIISPYDLLSSNGEIELEEHYINNRSYMM